MTSPIDTTFVQVEPDFSAFDSSVRSAVNDAGRVIERELEQAFNGVAREADQAGERIGREFQQGGESAERALDEVGDKGEREFDRIEREADDANRGIGSSFSKLGGIVAGAFAAVQIGQFFQDAAASAQEANSVLAATEQIIRSTGSAAGLTAQQVADLSGELSLEIGVDDEDVQSAANVLLTFRNVSEEVFERSIDLAADMSAVFGTDLSAASLQLGKALNDPVAGISALTRVGVTFTDQQKEQIEALVESGDVLGAQQVILEELEAQVGGTAAASADSTDKIAVAFDALKEALGGPLIAAIDEIAPALIGTLGALEPVLGALGEIVGGLIVQLQPILEVLGAALAEGLQALLPALEPIGAAVLAVVQAFAPLLPVIGQLLGTLLPPLARVLEIVANALAPLIALVAQLASEILSRLEPVFPPLVEIIGAVAGILGDVLGAILPVVIDLFLAIFSAVQPLIPLLLDLVRALLPVLDPILALVQALLPPLVQLLTSILIPLVSLLEPIIQLATLIAEALAPANEELITLLTDALVPILEVLAEVLILTVVPAIEFLSSILEGDFVEAFENAGGQIGFWRDLVVAVFNFVRQRIELAIQGAVAILRFFQRAGLAVFNAVRSFVRDRISAIVSAANRIRDFVTRVRNFFNQARDAVRSRINSVIDLVRGTPGRIRRALGNAASILRQAGRNIIQGLINGINSMLGRIRDTISNVAQTVRNFLPFSPAREGPLSGSGSPDRAGEAIARMIAEGMQSQLIVVERSARRVTGAVQSGIAAAAAEVLRHVGAGGDLFEDFSFRGNSTNVRRFNDQLADMFAREDETFNRRNVTDFLRDVVGDGGVRVRPSADAQRVEVTLHLRADDLLTGLRKTIRVQGGNVQQVIGTGGRS